MKKSSCKCTLCQKECKCSRYAALFRVLGNKNRLHIINALRRRDSTVSDIMQVAGMEQTSVSHSLAALKRQGFVRCTRNGKEMIYSLERDLVEPLMIQVDETARKLG